jgi:hypothetical protein
MWICARCGTEAQQPEICSGCGSNMKPFDQPSKEERFRFVLIDLKDPAAYGPFPSVISADMWAEKHVNHNDTRVVLMENPNDRETQDS